MRVVAFSDVHVATPDTQKWLFGALINYEHCHAFVRMMLAQPPDRLICVGDLCEEFWDGPDAWRELVPELTALTFEHLGGNHERTLWPQGIEIDGVWYEHGRTRPDTIDAARRNYAGKRVVHGHTHHPLEPWPLDLGSLTFTGTYGEIVDGEAALRSVIDGIA